MTALIYCPFPDATSAQAVGDALLDEGLVGCINIGGGIASFFCWEGERGEANECAVLMKTHETLLTRAVARLEDLHPYDTPAIVGWPCVAGSATKEWLAGIGKGPSSEAE